MLAMLHLLGTFVANLFKSRRRLEVENLGASSSQLSVAAAAWTVAPFGLGRDPAVFKLPLLLIASALTRPRLSLKRAPTLRPACWQDPYFQLSCDPLTENAMNTRSTVFALGVATLFWLVVTDASYSQDKVVEIGGLFPTSGPGAYFGAQDKQGIDLAVEQINKTGINGFKLEVKYEESRLQSTARNASGQATNRTVQASCHFGRGMLRRHTCGHASRRASEFALLNAGSSSIKITDPGNAWTFRIMPNEVMQGVDIATNAYKRLNAETAVLLYENTNAGIGNAKVFGDTFKSLARRISGRHWLRPRCERLHRNRNAHCRSRQSGRHSHLHA